MATGPSGLGRDAAAAPGARSGVVSGLAVDDEASWARREFQRSDLADGRLRQRLERLGAAWERHPGQPLPAIFPERPTGGLPLPAQ